MYVLVTYKDEENQKKNEGAWVVTTIIQLYLRCSRAANSVAGGWMWPKIKLIQTFMGVLVTCKNKEDLFKNEGVRVITTDLRLQVYADFLWCPREVNSTVWGWFYFKFKLIQAFMVVLVTSKIEEDPIKNEGARVATTILHYLSIFKILKGS